MVHVSNFNHSVGPTWTLKERDIIGNPGLKNRTVSTRILGIGIALFGVLVLAIGLIMGLEFPNYVRQQNKEKQCVFQESHENYRSWSEGSQWNRKVHVYYWTLVNAEDFLHKGDKPKFVQRGPYIYTETETKYDVNFAATELSYRKRKSHVFDQESTEAACSICHEQDRLTILSPWYLQAIGQQGGEEELIWSYIPTYLVTHLLAAGFISSNHGSQVLNHNASVLGNFVSVSTSFSAPPLGNISFGTWLYFSGKAYKSTIEAGRQGQDFTLSEVRSLYRVFTNLTLLLGKAVFKADKNVHQQCKEWAHSICCTSISTLLLDVSNCGLIYLLKYCPNNSSSSIMNIFQVIFCPSINTCLNFTGTPEDLSLAYTNAIADFLWHLTNIVLHSFQESNYFSLVISRNQSQLALGYDLDDGVIFQEIRVSGLLQSSYVGETRIINPQWRVYTCLENRNINNNMKLKEFNNSWSTPDLLLRDARKASLSSYTDYVAPCPDLATCKTCSSPGDTMSFFAEDLLRAVTFMLNSSSSVAGVDVFKYELNSNTFDRSSSMKIEGGLQNMSDLVSYLSWASLPLMSGGSTEHFIVFDGSTPSSSYVLIEPVTGRVWERSIKLQWNLGISQYSAQARDRNISVAELPLPIMWTERIATISDSEIRSYKHLITRLMTVSCGGIIGFGAISLVIFVAGIVVCVYPFKPNRISPVVEEFNSVPKGRHL